MRPATMSMPDGILMIFLSLAPALPLQTQSTAFTSQSITSNSMTVGWTRGNGTGVLVVARTGSPVDTDPVNGTTYAASFILRKRLPDRDGNYVVYNGTGTSVNLTNLSPGISYHYAIYEYSTTNCYLTPALTGKCNYITRRLYSLGNSCKPACFLYSGRFNSILSNIKLFLDCIK